MHNHPSSRKTVISVGAAALMLASLGSTATATEEPLSVAVLYVGHGEPAALSDGDAPVSFSDGAAFGPHAETLDVPPELQSTEWAAAYDEIATAMTYIFEDINGNEISHEMKISPAGDVPPFFTYQAYYDELTEMYEAFDDYSPHNDLIRGHIASLDVEMEGTTIDSHIAFLDAVPRIHDVAPELAAGGYDQVVVVPLLLASSTHTQEVEEQVEEALHGIAGTEVTVAEPFFEVPYMRSRIKDAVMSMAQHLRAEMPADIDDADIGVVLVSHGTPYTPAHPAFGWTEGEIFSNLVLTEDLFHEEIASELPWPSRTGRMNYAEPSIEDALTELEELGLTHVMILPTAFPTTAAHTMWHVAVPAVGRAITREEGTVTHERDSGMHVYHTALGYADIEPGDELFRDGLEFVTEIGIMEAVRSEMRDHS